MKNVDDVTREDIIDLVKCAIELLGCARMLYWESGGDESAGDDKSHREALDAMANSLAAIGLPQVTHEQFEENLQSLLTSGMPPTEWIHGDDDGAIQ